MDHQSRPADVTSLTEFDVRIKHETFVAIAIGIAVLVVAAWALSTFHFFAPKPDKPIAGMPAASGQALAAPWTYRPAPVAGATVTDMAEEMNVGHAPAARAAAEDVLASRDMEPVQVSTATTSPAAQAHRATVAEAHTARTRKHP